MNQVQGSKSFHPDVMETWRIIRHFRDLNNLASLCDYKELVQKWVDRLIQVGWSSTYIRQFQNLGACGTRFEKLIPHVSPERGDRIQYRKDKGRHK